MNGHTSELKYTVGKVEQIPNDNLFQIIMSGRSNVGKSSLINTLLVRNKLARVSSTPGKTITINYYLIDKSFYFTDLPGYGFAKRPYCEKEQWSKLVDSYFGTVTNEKKNSACVLQLIDLKVGPTADDIQMLDFLNYTELPYFIVATKTDKLNQTEKAKAVERLSTCEHIKPQTPIILFSSLKNIGVKEVWNEIYKFVK